MESFKAGFNFERQNTENTENSEVAGTEELKPEQAFANERGALEKFSGKAKEVAGVLLLITALSAAPDMVREAYSQEKESPAKVEQLEKRKAVKEFTFKEFEVGAKEGGHDVKMEFLDSDVEETLKEQNILFDEKEGSFTLLNERKETSGGLGFPTGKDIVVKFMEMNGVRTERVEVSVVKIDLPMTEGRVIKKIIAIKSYNSDGSIDMFTVLNGKIAGFATEKPKK